jgi:outer membrane protein assembly factor BamA
MKRVFIYYTSLVFLLFFCSEIKPANHTQISNITIIGNLKIHDYIILRELPFKIGDLVENNLLENLLLQGRDNLINLSLFNFVYISQKTDLLPVDTPLKRSEIIISVDERWYYWPLLSFSLEERNFGNWIKDPEWEKITIKTGLILNGIGGKNQTFTASLMSGYSNGINLELSNISLDNKGHHFGGISLMYRYSKTLNSISSIDRPVLIRAKDGYLEKLYNISFTYIFRPRPRFRNRIIVEFESTQIDSVVLVNNRDYWGGERLKRDSYSATYGLTFDERDNLQYPLEGYYIDLQIFGYLSSGMEVQYTQLKGDVQYYTQLNNKFSASARVQCAFSAKNANAYIFDRALGYGEQFLHGYEKYIADGQHYMLLSPTFRYKILPTTVYNMKFLSFLPKFNKVPMTVYYKTFADAGYVYHKNQLSTNTMSNKWLLSCGLGVDVVTYYDLTFSLDYSFNRMRESALFFSVKRALR